MNRDDGRALKEYLADRKAVIDRALAGYLPGEESYPPMIFQAVRYSVLAGGKRLRPILCLAAAEAVGGTCGPILPVACALELIHTYSLIHDDLPAMDNDDYRRGRPTSHKVFGEDIAILAGDALLTEAFRLMTRRDLMPGMPPERLLDAIGEIAEAAGFFGMVGGQVLDIRSEGEKVDLDTLHRIHRMKTGAMIRVSLRAGAILSGASDEQTRIAFELRRADRACLPDRRRHPQRRRRSDPLGQGDGKRRGPGKGHLPGPHGRRGVAHAGGGAHQGGALCAGLFRRPGGTAPPDRPVYPGAEIIISLNCMQNSRICASLERTPPAAAKRRSGKTDTDNREPMTDNKQQSILARVNFPKDIRRLSLAELQGLAEEIREMMIETVSRQGGHLASSLGTVELTLALHYVFDTPRDRLVWDVGHQAYAHKIITGRKERFDTLRQKGGISGFPKREESPYDVFDVGHSGTSISAAAGMAEARCLKGEDFRIIAVIGDGSMSAGMAFEGLNWTGDRKKNLIIILNDNEMCISPNVGALSSYLNRIMTGQTVTRIKNEVKIFLKSVPGIGEQMLKFSRQVEESLKTFFVPGAIFEELGFTYVGPLEGHRLDHLIKTLENVRQLYGPRSRPRRDAEGKGL